MVLSQPRRLLSFLQVKLLEACHRVQKHRWLASSLTSCHTWWLPSFQNYKYPLHPEPNAARATWVCGPLIVGLPLWLVETHKGRHIWHYRLICVVADWRGDAKLDKDIPTWLWKLMSWTNDGIFLGHVIWRILFLHIQGVGWELKTVEQLSAIPDLSQTFAWHFTICHFAR